MTYDENERQYTIILKCDDRKWVIIDNPNPDANLGYYYHKEDAMDVANMLNQRVGLLDTLITTLDLAVGHACDSRGVTPAECDDWPWVKQARKLITKAKGGE